MRFVSIVLFLLIAAFAQAADLYIAGSNAFDLRGTGRTLVVSTPTQVATGVVEVASDSYSLIWRDSSGNLWGRGNNQGRMIADSDAETVEDTMLIDSGVISIHSAKDYHLFYKKGSGIWARGNNATAQIGAFKAVLQSTTFVGSDLAQVSASANSSFAVFLTTAGAARPSGSLSSGVVKVAATEFGAFALKSDNTLWFFGTSTRGVAGLGQDGYDKAPTQVMTNVADFSVDSQFDGVAVIKQDGTLWTAGDNNTGRLGLSSLAGNAGFLAPVDTNVVEAKISGPVMVYRKADGSLWGCGSNGTNTFGTGEVAQYSLPRQIATSVASYSLLSALVYLKTDGTVWVADKYLAAAIAGQGAANGGPVQVPGNYSGATVTSHGNFVSILKNGVLYALGDNTQQSILTSGTVNNASPVYHRSNVISAASTWGTNLFVVTADGTLWLSGLKTIVGGLYMEPGASTLPQAIATNVREVTTAGGNILFRKADGTLWGLGFDLSYALGTGTARTTVPVQIATNVKKVCPTRFHVLFIKNDNSLWMSGSNSWGIFSIGSFAYSNGPIQIAADVKDAVGEDHLLYVKLDGTLWGSGSNYGGQLSPTGTYSDAITTPIQLMGNVKAVACTSSTSFALKENGDLVAFGTDPVRGTMGYAETIDTRVTSIAAGAFSVFAYIKDDGTAWTGGTNLSGSLGQGTFELGRFLKAQIATNASSIFIETMNTLVLKEPATAPAPSSPSATGRPINLSVRGAAGQGDQTLIAGFTISGSESKTVLIRVSGPGLAPFLNGYVANPTLKIYNASNTVVALNDDWDVALKNDFASVGAFAWTDGSKDAAVKVSLPPGGYTIHVGNTGAKAESLIEVYDFGKETGSKLSNVSCRVLENPDDPVIMGVTLDKSANLLARNGGPSLKILGVSTAADDTHLVAFNGDKTELARNDDFDPSLSSTFSQAGAYSYGPSGKDAALLLNAAPTSFTLHCTSKGGSGVGLCEVYLLE